MKCQKTEMVIKARKKDCNDAIKKIQGRTKEKENYNTKKNEAK